VSVGPVAAARAVRRRFGRGPTAVTAVADATLLVLAGEVISIMGPSGSGKSTLLCLLGGLLTPDEGEVELMGNDLGGLSPGARAELRRRHLGFVFQRFNLLKGLTALDNVALALELTGCSAREARERARRGLEEVGLERCAGHLPRDLSGGEQQRVAVVRALAPAPALILADEPTGNLDSANGRAVIELLCAHARDSGAGVVIVTHDPRVGEVVDRRLWMEDGVLQGGERAGAPELRAAPL
jgi:putative ABC transport system ATP-binding protein